MLGRYQLATCYASLRSAVRGGRWPEATALLSQALGVDLGPPPSAEAVAHAARTHLVRQLSYRGFKPAELAMVAADLKPVVKLEDIPLAQAHAFAGRHRPSRAVLLGEPYHKDDWLLRSSPCAEGDPRALCCMYVSSTHAPSAAAQLMQLEAQSREDVLGAARLLDIPPCCAAAFQRDFERSRDDQDALNDEACARLLGGLAAAPSPWWLNPLSDHELLGFYPCSSSCPEAAARAKRNWQALRQLAPQQAALARQRLAQPVLFFRLPFFAVLPAHDGPQRLTMGRIAVNRFGDPLVAAAQALLAALLVRALPAGGELVNQPEGCGALTPDGHRRLWPRSTAGTPIVVHWQHGEQEP